MEMVAVTNYETLQACSQRLILISWALGTVRSADSSSQVVLRAMVWQLQSMVLCFLCWYSGITLAQRIGTYYNESESAHSIHLDMVSAVLYKRETG